MFNQGYHELQHDQERDELLEKSFEFIKKIPNLKNFGPMMVHPIRKPMKKGNPIVKIILALIVIIGFLKKFKVFPFKK